MTQSISHWTFFQLQLFNEYFLTDRVWKPALHPLIQLYLCKWLGSLTAAFLCSLHTAIIQKRLKKEKKAKRKLQEALEYESKRREQVEQTLKQTSPTESLRSLNGETTCLSNVNILQFVKRCIFAISCGFLDMEFAMLIKVTSCKIYLIHLLRIIWWNMLQYVRDYYKTKPSHRGLHYKGLFWDNDQVTIEYSIPINTHLLTKRKEKKPT